MNFIDLFTAEKLSAIGHVERLMDETKELVCSQYVQSGYL